MIELHSGFGSEVRKVVSSQRVPALLLCVVIAELLRLCSLQETSAGEVANSDV